MISFAVERWPTFYADAKYIFDEHWKEAALDRDKITLSIDLDKYAALDKSGMLHIMVMRDDRVVVGYYLSLVFLHPHYKDAGPMAFVDVYYLRRKYRKGAHGIMLFKETEKSLKELGVTKMYGSCKAKMDKTKLFLALGWQLADFCFAKYIGG